jgi:hypothetical protein
VRERRVLALTVAVRRELGPFGRANGDLLGAVQSALRGLVASGDVVQVDEAYVLARRAMPRRPTRTPDSARARPQVVAGYGRLCHPPNDAAPSTASGFGAILPSAVR